MNERCLQARGADTGDAHTHRITHHMLRINHIVMLCVRDPIRSLLATHRLLLLFAAVCAMQARGADGGEPGEPEARPRDAEGVQGE